MPRSNEEIIVVLKAIYREEFGGKAGQRFLIAWADLRALYGYEKLFNSRFAGLAALAVEKGLYLFDLGEGANGHMISVMRRGTVDRWRKVPRKVIAAYILPPSVTDDSEEDDTDE